MLYSGHFSFDEHTDPDNQRHGYFTCVVQAGTPELALMKFKQRILKIKEVKQEALFKNITSVYVEDIVEIGDQPGEAVVTRFQSSDGPFPKSVSCSLPTSNTQKIKAFQWVPDSENTVSDGGYNAKDDYEIATPFLKFE